MMAEAVWQCKLDEPEKAAAVGICVAERCMEKLDGPFAAIFDIDETLLKNHEFYDDGDEEEYAVQPCGKMLFQWCKKNGVNIFLVTARRKGESARDYAVRQLKDLDYDMNAVTGLYMTSKEYDELDDAGAKFKKAARDKICAEYDVILNCGDRWSMSRLSQCLRSCLRRPMSAFCLKTLKFTTLSNFRSSIDEMEAIQGNDELYLLAPASTSSGDKSCSEAPPK